MRLERCSVGSIRDSLLRGIVFQGSFKHGIEIRLSNICFVLSFKCLFDSLSSLFLRLLDWFIFLSAVLLSHLLFYQGFIKLSLGLCCLSLSLFLLFFRFLLGVLGPLPGVFSRFNCLRKLLI